MRLSKILLTPGIFLAAALIALVAAFTSVGVIERVSQAAVNKAMILEGQDWVHVEVDGLQVILSGTAPTEPDRFRALSVAGGEVDASRVIDQVAVPQAQNIQPPRFSIEILRNDAGISMIGLVPAAFDRTALAERVAKITPDNPPADLLETADYPVPERWDEVVDFGIFALETLPRAKISIDTDRIEVEAIADSDAEKAGWERTLARRSPGGLRVALDISAPRPVITPFTARFVADETGARFDACTAGTEAGRAKIVRAGLDAGTQGRTDCIIGLGMPTGEWPDAVALGVEAVGALGHATITFSDADVTLVVGADVAQADYDRVVGELEADLPDVFTLHSSKTQLSEESDEAPEFTATLSPEGQVQLRGRLASEQERVITESVARARFGGDKAYMAARLDPNLPQGWSVRVLAAIEALALLDNGIATVRPDLVELRGKTGDKGANAEISRLLSEQLGEAQDFRVNVIYDEALDPIAQLPSPEECVADVNAVLAETKITFAPASVEIDASSGEILDRIADILRECKDVPMEVGGHTDSQGGEELNKALSQQRANSVLNALLARRVLTTNIIAYGYGEEKPIADNETEEGREENRRIAFRLLGAQEFEQLANGNRVALIAADGLSGRELEELFEIRPRPRPANLNTSVAEEEPEADAEDPATGETPETETTPEPTDVAAEDAPQTDAAPEAETDGTQAADTANGDPEPAPDATPDAAEEGTDEAPQTGEEGTDEPPADTETPEESPTAEGTEAETAQAPTEATPALDTAPTEGETAPEPEAETPPEGADPDAAAEDETPPAQDVTEATADEGAATDEQVAEITEETPAPEAETETGTEEPLADPVVVHPDLEGVRAPPRPVREE